MSSITIDDVKKLATLSALTISDDDAGAMLGDLEQILDYVDLLQTVDTDDVAPTYQVHPLDTVTRRDVIIEYGVSQESLLQNAPKQEAASIVVPRVLE